MLIPDKDGNYDPKEVAAEAASLIRLRPERHDQTVWLDFGRNDDPDHECEMPVGEIVASLYAEEGSCGTTACVAGWVAILTAPWGSYITDSGSVVWPDGSLHSIELAGQGGLGLGYDAAHWLFAGDRERAEVLTALDRLAKGERIRGINDADS